MNTDADKNPSTRLLMATQVQLTKPMWVISKQMITNDETGLCLVTYLNRQINSGSSPLRLDCIYMQGHASVKTFCKLNLLTQYLLKSSEVSDFR